MIEKEQIEQQLLDSIHNETTVTPQNELESTIFNHIKNFAILGREYSRSGYVASMLKKNKSFHGSQIQKQLFHKLVTCGELSLDYPIELAKSNISIRFKKHIFDEIKKMPPRNNKNLLDLTDLETYTIDNESTKDRDDAFSLSEDIIWIHITDVSSLIEKDSILDKEAFNRSSTLYLPEGTIPMLPISISEEIGSINVNEPKKCLSLKLTTNQDGEIIDSSFHQTLIKSNKSISYKESDLILSDKTHELYCSMKKIQKTTEWTRQQRYESGAFELLTRDEMRVNPNISEQVSVEVVKRDSPSSLLIAELMITYNCKIAEFLKNHQIPASYKTQKSPDTDELNNLPKGILGNYMIGRILQPSIRSRSADWHFGLGVNVYTQASSPLRRYSDLCIQRQIINYIETGNISYSEDEISAICHSVDTQMRNLSQIEKTRTRYWFLKYLQESYIEKDNTIMEAVSLEDGSDRRTAFQLNNYPYRNKCIFTHKIKAGQKVTVKLSGVDLWEKTAQFTYLQQ